MDTETKIGMMLRSDVIKTNQQIADEMGCAQSWVATISKRWLTPEELAVRKRLNYQASRFGDKNPSYGKRGEECGNYKGEISSGDGYLMIVKPSWYTGRKGSHHVFVHTLVMCKSLGLTELPASFVVHHIDGNKTNNELSNLALMTNSAHSRLHQRERATTISKESRGVVPPKRGTSIVVKSGKVLDDIVYSSRELEV